MIGLELQPLLAVGSGALVGIVLGLIGGGGSILAVPLLVYVVGIESTHVAIGTSAVAVAASALLGLAGHMRAHHVKWPCAIVFAVTGIAGAAGGATLGKMVDGASLIGLFGVLMIVVAALMLRPRHGGEDAGVRLTSASARRLLPALVGSGLVVGGVAGFFGVGGGFLIVPGLIGATAMPLLNAIGSSLVSVSVFGATTAASYAASGLVDWPIAGLFVAGGAGGAAAGVLLARRLAARRRALTFIFALAVMSTGAVVVFRALAEVA